MQNFTVKALTLTCTHLPEIHTAANIKTCLTKITENWSLDLSNVPVYVVTDSGRNIRASAYQIDWTPLQCLEHTFQLAVRDTKEETLAVSLMCKKARVIAGHYKHSAQATRRLKDCQKGMELPAVSLIQDVDTRWNSEHAMLSYLVELIDAVSLEMAASETSVSCLSPSEWNVAASLVQVLQPIVDATADFSSQRYGAISTVVSFLCGTEQILRSHCDIENEAGLFSKNLLWSLKSRFPLFMEQKEPMLAMLRDPRFKSIFCIDSFDQTRAVELLVAEVSVRCACVDSPSEQFKRQELSEPPTSPKKSLQTVCETVELLASQKIPRNNPRPNSQEIQKYLNEPLIPRSTTL
ncbi:hypothetical protein HPB48_006327 [Haemaphysalis longicornis]|uniref:Uncharacterized protein n=1 Tax=Haemaphysalis longicornis TaxID=44386 RepID=A0A9J6F734_HAELO|nr:hypothetical protein HPB48_006327 [Haemaphysalis longicornis]